MKARPTAEIPETPPGLMLLGPGDGTVAIHEAECALVERARRLKWPAIYPISGRFRERLVRGDCPGCRAVSDRVMVG